MTRPDFVVLHRDQPRSRSSRLSARLVQASSLEAQPDDTLKGTGPITLCRHGRRARQPARPMTKAPYADERALSSAANRMWQEPVRLFRHARSELVTDEHAVAAPLDQPNAVNHTAVAGDDL